MAGRVGHSVPADPIKIEITPVQKETLDNCTVILVKVPDHLDDKDTAEELKRIFSFRKGLRFALYNENMEFTFVQGRDDKTVQELMDETLDKLKEENDT